MKHTKDKNMQDNKNIQTEAQLSADTKSFLHD